MLSYFISVDTVEGINGLKFSCFNLFLLEHKRKYIKNWELQDFSSTRKFNSVGFQIYGTSYTNLLENNIYQT